MLKHQMNSSEILMVGGPVCLALLSWYFHWIHQDNFTNELKSLAGENAVSCGAWPESSAYDQRINQCKTWAFQQQRPFWLRKEGEVYTAEGEYYRIVRRYPKGLRAAQITKQRWVNPYVVTWPSGLQVIEAEQKIEVEN